ncbi:FHY3/FAR1 family protein [Dioscorea alata]|uniref:FHY3/FAR1 family protein n=1 Tax=Dioscorea alata TaxID=55571 RepID=A0ACB7W382_DIOAL|nr:FHY3/FAR1 family protein [Dioscorea alata]
MADAIDGIDLNELGLNGECGGATQENASQQLENEDDLATQDVQELAMSPKSRDGQELARIPFVGMEFEDEEEAFRYYLDYAKCRGFGVRKGHVYRASHSQIITCRHFVCDKEGAKLADKRQLGKIIQRRRDTRTNCKARVVVSKMKNGLWTVKTFEDVHNHHLLRTPSKVMKMRSHRHISTTCRSLIETLHKSRVGPSQMSRILNETLSSTGSALITPNDCSNHLRGVRSNNIGQECVAIVKFFKEKKLNDDFFFFDMELDEFGQTRCVFWADGRSRVAYSEFGDVVVFDTTYQTNRFCFPFAPFVGINHHKQSILFGCALMADEKEESFVWVFQTWLKCMLGKHPQTIITDQDLAMGNAIAHVFPSSGHRLCSWHIGRNSMKYLVDLKSNDGFMRDYTNWLHHSESIEAFEDRWGELKATYNIDDKHWLSRMYEIRSKWVSLYCESINSFFDGFVNAQTSLDEFVMQYDKALSARRNAEESEDFKTLNSIANFYTGHPIERHVGEVELRESDSMLAERIRDGSDYAKYAICNHVVVFGKNCTEDGEPYAMCSCKKFEREGVLCCHILKIFKKKEVPKIPKKYILRRWSMDARYRSSVMMVETHNNAFTPLMKWSAQNMCFRIAQSISSVEMYEKIMPKLNDIFEMVTETSNTLRTKQNEENEEVIGSCSMPTFSCDNDVHGSQRKWFSKLHALRTMYVENHRTHIEKFVKKLLFSTINEQRLQPN